MEIGFLAGAGDEGVCLLNLPRMFDKVEDQSTYDYVKLYIGYFSIRIPVWERIFTF